MGPYGLDLQTGKVLWRLTAKQSPGAQVTVGGLAWVQGADGYVALDDRTGKPLAQHLDRYPRLALAGEQVQDGTASLEALPLPH